jgi:hypothetical protein
MRRITLGIALLAVGGLVVLAGPNLANASTKAAAPVLKSSPYSYFDTDGGTCGGDAWALDLGVRTFTQPNHDPAGNYAIVETFSQGHFSTVGGVSPGACDDPSRTNNGHLVREGVAGTFFGTYHIFIQGGTFAALDGSCNGFPSSDPDHQCTTASYVTYHYGSGATLTGTSYTFTYKSSAAGVLAPKSWVEKSTDGNTEVDTGDIRTS